jgi:prefoldin subunit 5
MAETVKKNSLEAQIEALNQEYDALLERGAEFSVLREIKDRIKALKSQFPSNGNGKAGNNYSQNGNP